MMFYFKPFFFLVGFLGVAACASADDGATKTFIQKHCIACHDAETKKGDLDLTALPYDYTKPETFARWVKVHDKIASGEMPPKKKPRPAADELATVTKSLHDGLVAAEQARIAGEVRTGVRRLT